MKKNVRGYPQCGIKQYRYVLNRNGTNTIEFQ